MKTVQDLYDQIYLLIEEEFALLDAQTKANYLARRNAIIAATREVWDKAAIDPRLDATVGNMVYVSKAEAFKYGRFERLNELVTEEAKIGALTDISNFEKAGVRIYATEYDGFAWAYSSGYALPLTGGAKVRLVANALYSDFYGASFDVTVKKNLGAYAQNIIDTTARALNQGASYSKIASQLTEVTDRAYANALRVARTEGGRIQSVAYLDNLALLDEVGVKYEKAWLATKGNRTREDHNDMNNKYADKKGVFHLPSGATGPAPRLTGVASDDINCRCTTITVVAGMRPDNVPANPKMDFAEYSKRSDNVTVSAVRSAKPPKR